MSKEIRDRALGHAIKARSSGTAEIDIERASVYENYILNGYTKKRTPRAVINLKGDKHANGK